MNQQETSNSEFDNLINKDIDALSQSEINIQHDKNNDCYGSSQNSSTDYDSDDNSPKKNSQSKDRSHIFENRIKKLKLSRLSYHPDSVLRKKSAIYYFEIHGIVKNMIDKRYLYERLSSFDVIWKKKQFLSKPKTLVVDLRTSCPEYLEEQNVKELYSVQDISFIYLDFDTQIASEILDIYLDKILDFQFYIKHFQMKKPKMNIKSFQDRTLYFHGLSFEDFNDKVAAWQWAKKFEKKSYSNDFFYQRFKSKLNLDSVIERIRRPLPDYQCLRPVIQLKDFGNYYDKIVKWYNKRVTRGFEHKNRQLFVYGEANKGKSYIINALLGGLDHQKFVLRQNDKNFILDGWDPYKYSHIICDEINLDNFDQEIYKLITEGAQISANRKNEKASIVSCRVPMIFIANKKPKQYPGLYERLKFVKADIFIKILNINDYLKFDWSIPENQLRCQPNPELMPIFSCLNTTPPNLAANFNNDSGLAMTPSSLSCSVSEEIVQTNKQYKKRLLESDEEVEYSLREKSSFEKINQLLNESINENENLDIFAILEKILEKRRTCQLNQSSTPILSSDQLSPSQKKLTSFFKPLTSANASFECSSLDNSSINEEKITKKNQNNEPIENYTEIDSSSTKSNSKKKAKSKNSVKSSISIMTRSNSKKQNK